MDYKQQVKPEMATEWSKEDMDIINGMIMDYEGEIEHLSDSAIDEQAKPIYQERIKFLNRLKSLYHVKQEWSKEDSVRLQRIIDFLWHNRKGDTDTIYQQEQDIEWLKSLVFYKKWKPSEKQINALSDVLSIRDIKYDVLSELLECLKKLK